MTIDNVYKGFTNIPFLNFIGFEILTSQEGNVKLKLSVTDQLLNANGTLHGGVHASMLDIILGLTIRSITKTRCTTINLNINYLNLAKGKDLFATGKIIKQGYRNVTAEGEIYDVEGGIVAKATGTYKLLRT